MPRFRRKASETRAEVSPYATLSDPGSAFLLGAGGGNYSGEYVTESSALSLSAVWRACMLVAGTIGTLPLKTYRDLPSGEREKVSSWLDNPAGPDSITPLEWKETVVLHLLIQGETFLLHRYNNAGAIIGTTPIHPLAVNVERVTAAEAAQTKDGRAAWPEGKKFVVRLVDGTNVVLSGWEITHIPGPITDGLRGMSFLQYGRNSIGMGLAAERSAANQYTKGALIPGVLTPAPGEDLDREDAEAIAADLDQHLFGRENAGRIPLLNRVLQFQPWAMTNLDAQFMESRQFQIEEISRWTGVPPFLLMQLEKQTSWGTGVAEQNKNLSQYVLNGWCMRIAQRVSRAPLLPQPRFAEFDMAGLEAGSVQDEISLLLSQVNGGFLTVNEGRRVRNLPPIDGGDELRIPSGVMLQAQLEASAAATEQEAEQTELDPAPQPAADPATTEEPQ